MSNPNPHDEVPIIIDRKQYKSTNPTTGAALYLIASVPNDYDLFEEVQGHGDDKLIGNDNSVMSLKAGQHFYTAQRKLNPGCNR